MDRTILRGRWALVTGASRGVGRQISMGLADCGCNVVLHSRNLAHTATLAEELAAKGVQVRQIAAELAQPVEVDALIAWVLTHTPGIDILYNNAAIMTPYRHEWLETPAEDFRVSFEVNTIAPIRICLGLIPGMVERKWGRIVNVTSGVRDQPEMMAYAASKAALDKFVYDTAGRLARDGVLMNLLDPGWLRTDLGGPNAPNPVETVLPGALVPVLIEDGVHGQLFRAQDYVGQTL